MPCPGGRFGNTSALPDASCTGSCSEGYYCPAGSSNASAVPCGGTDVYVTDVSRVSLHGAFYASIPVSVFLRGVCRIVRVSAVVSAVVFAIVFAIVSAVTLCTLHFLHPSSECVRRT